MESTKRMMEINSQESVSNKMNQESVSSRINLKSVSCNMNLKSVSSKINLETISLTKVKIKQVIKSKRKMKTLR